MKLKLSKEGEEVKKSLVLDHYAVCIDLEPTLTLCNTLYGKIINSLIAKGNISLVFIFGS